MSGRLAVKTKNVGWCGPETSAASRLPGPRFLPAGLGLDGRGAAGSRTTQTKSAAGCDRLEMERHNKQLRATRPTRATEIYGATVTRILFFPVETTGPFAGTQAL